MISVIIPVHNRAELLERAVRSVLAQSYRDFELVVVDDGSTEAFDSVQKLLAANGQRLIRQERRGVAAARNRGIAESSGEWIALLDSDDVWLPSKLERQMVYARSNPQCRIFQSRERWYRNGRRVNPRQRHEMRAGNIFAQSLELCVVSSSSVLFQRSLFEECGPYDENLWLCEDYDLWIRIAARYSFGLLDEELADKFAGHDDQLSRSEAALDRYRIYSLLKNSQELSLSGEQSALISQMFAAKSALLAAGAEKRGNARAAGLYREIQQLAQSEQSQAGPSQARNLLERLNGELTNATCNAAY